MSAFHLKMCLFSMFYYLTLMTEKIKKKRKRKGKKKSREKGRKRSLGGFMFSLQITSQSHSLHLGNSPACLGAVGQEEGRERKREGHGSCFLKQRYKKRLKNPYYSQVVKIITVRNSIFCLFVFLNKGSVSSAPCFYRVDCLQKEKKPNKTTKKPNQNTNNPASGVFPSVSTLIREVPTVQRPGHAHRSL